MCEQREGEVTRTYSPIARLCWRPGKINPIVVERYELDMIAAKEELHWENEERFTYEEQKGDYGE